MKGKFLEKAVFELNLETHKEYDHLEMGSLAWWERMLYLIPS